jgi:hypothetical protein
MEVWSDFRHPSEVWNDAIGGPFTKQQAKTVHREMERVRKSTSGPIRPIWDFAESRAQGKVKQAARRRVLTAVGTRAAARYAITGSAGAMLGMRVASLGLRVVPIVGWAMLAYDIWTLGDALFGDDD